MGIDDFSASLEKSSFDKFPNFEKSDNYSIINISGHNIEDTFVSDDGGEMKKLEIKMIHTVFKGKNNELKVPFNFHEESDGTQKMFALIGPWIDALRNGHSIIVDELDTKLHQLLNVFLIKLFHDPTQNKNNAQLIFTTHNTNLLSLDLFRRDQIWFTEKNPDTGSTSLYSLLEFKPRKDQNIQKGYLAGRFGAIPFISDERIFLEKKD